MEKPVEDGRGKKEEKCFVEGKRDSEVGSVLMKRKRGQRRLAWFMQLVRRRSQSSRIGNRMQETTRVTRTCRRIGDVVEYEPQECKKWIR